MRKLNLFFACILFLTLIMSLQLSSQNIKYKITNVISLNDEGKWDYLAIDYTLNRLYVTHETRVHVIDLKNYSIIGEIKDLNSIHGVAIVPELNKGYISNGGNDVITIFDTKTLKTINNIKIPGKMPDAIIFDPFTKRVFSFNGKSNNATALDVLTDKIAGNIALDGKPEFSVFDGKGKMYVNIEDKNEVAVFDPLKLRVITYWQLAPLETPTGMAIDLERKRLFVVGRNKLMAVINTENGKIISTLPIGGGVDGCAYDPVMHLIFSSNNEGTITIIQQISADEYKVIENIATQKGARTITLDKNTHKIYTSAIIDEKNNYRTKDPGKKRFGVLVLENK